MNKPVKLADGKLLVGLANIVLSEVDDIVYINSLLQVDDGISGALAFYKTDGQCLAGTSEGLTWDASAELLRVKNLETTVLSPSYCNATKVSISKWLGFPSKLTENQHPFRFCTRVDEHSNQEVLILVVNGYDDTSAKVSMKFDSTRVYIDNTLNIRNTTIMTSVGSENDKIGDVAIDENYIYYCHKNYDGESKIWKRVEMKDW